MGAHFGEGTIAMAVPADSTLPRIQRDRRGYHSENRAPGAHPAPRPRRARVTEEGRGETPPRASWWSAADQAQFRVWLRVYAEALDADVRAHAQAQLAQIMLAGDRLFLLMCRIRDYEERWEVYQETLVHALRRLPWLWDRFGPQADLALYLPLCLRTVLARRALQPVLVSLAAESIDPARDVETQLAHAECTSLLWDLTTDLREYVQAHASRWGPRAASWFEATYVAGHSVTDIARQAQVSREHVHRSVRKILLDPALIAWLEDYFARRLGCPLQEALRALAMQDPRQDTPVQPLLQALFQWRATYEDHDHA